MKLVGTCTYLVSVIGNIRLMHINKSKKSYLSDTVHLIKRQPLALYLKIVRR